MRNLFLTFLLLASLSSPARAETLTLKGFITSPNGTGVEGVTIRHPDTGRSAITSEDGHFLLAEIPDAALEIIVKKALYETKTVKLSDHADLGRIEVSVGRKWNLIWPLTGLCGLLGVLSGFQLLTEKLTFAFQSYRSIWGIAHFLIRGLVPAVVFLIISLSNTMPPWHPAIVALTAGIGSEALLRSKFFLNSDSGSQNDRYLNIFWLIEWYANWTADRLEEDVAPGVRQRIAEKISRENPNFLVRWTAFRRNVGAETNATEIQEALEDLKTTFESGLPSEPDALRDWNLQFTQDLVFRLFDFLSSKRIGEVLKTEDE